MATSKIYTHSLHDTLSIYPFPGKAVIAEWYFLKIIFSDSKNITLLRFSDNLEEGSINIGKYLQMLQKYLSSHVVGGSVSWKDRSCGMVHFENYFLGFKKYYPLEIFR